MPGSVEWLPDSSGFFLITDVLLRKEIKDYRAGNRATYDLYPEALTGREQIMLLDSLKAIGRLRRRLRRDLMEVAM